MTGRRPTDVQAGPGFFDEEQQTTPEICARRRATPSRTGRRLIVEADGGSRGNPGPAAYGALVRDAETGEVVAQEGRVIGQTTNNVAEYSGLIAGLEMARAIDPGAAVEVRMDSKLVIEQMAGRWKIKHPQMKPLAMAASRLRPAAVVWTWVPRAENKAADALVNAALDGAPVRRGV
ncbi:MAG TPA: reverse transcriptase-like protein [Propionibacteriaceae bacterium]|nr:reverse transcriptase-like protein [Propionibacteriaceae bacterium]